MSKYTREEKIQVLELLAFYLAGNDDLLGERQVMLLETLISVISGGEVQNNENELNRFFYDVCEIFLDDNEQNESEVTE